MFECPVKVKERSHLLLPCSQLTRFHVINRATMEDLVELHDMRRRKLVLLS